MSLLSALAALLRNLFRRTRVERDLDAELREFVELVTAEKVRDGMSPARARRAALAEVGGVEQVKEDVRDARRGATLDILARDVRIGTRGLLRTPGFTIAAVLALALGVGATTAMLSVVNTVLLRPLPYANADRLVVVMHQGRSPVAPANFVDWRAQSRSFSAMGAAEYWTPNLTSGDDPEHLLGLHLTADLLPMLGVQPLLGRVFTSADDQPGSSRVAVIGYGLWQRRFGGDRGIVGHQIALDGQPVTIIGVMPRTFQFAPFWATKAELWAPLAFGERANDRASSSLRVFAQLRPGVTIDQARADIAAVTTHLEQVFPGTNRDVRVVALRDKVVGDVQTPLVVLLVAVSFVLLIACANVAHMLLARATSRQKELAVRTALGASRRRLVAQLLVESLMLALAGGGAGLVLAFWGIRALVAAAPAMIPRVVSVTMDGRVLSMTFAITVATAVMFGLLPALRAARVDLAATFRDGDRGSSDGGGRHRLRSVLVASEFALALILLVSAGLMMRSFAALQHVDAGFDPRDVVTMTISSRGTVEADPSARSAFFTEALARIRSMPGVQSAAYINHLPITGDQWGFQFAVEGRPTPKPGEFPTATYRVISPGYFGTMRIPLLRGRDFTDTDRADVPKVVVINEYMAETYWPNQDAVGKRISVNGSPFMTIVGVTKNTVINQWGAAPAEEFFFPVAQSPYVSDDAGHYSDLTLVARVSCAGRPDCDVSAFAASITRTIRDIDRHVPISAVETMAHAVRGATAESRFYLVLLAAFAMIAVALAAVGIYGVMSYSVSRRTNEIGIRIALGADPRSVVGLIVRQGLAPAVLGAMTGIAGALALTRLMAGLLYGVGPTDPATFAVVTLLLGGVGVLATYLPARRATKVDPLAALRAE